MAIPVPLSLQIMAILTWKEMPCVEFLQIVYRVNFRIVILIYLAIAANEAFFVIVTVTWGIFFVV